VFSDLRPALFAAAAFLAAASGWVIAGWVVSWLAIGELDLPARAGGVFFALSLANAALARLVGRK
jgi:hypothetical protein